jgi:serine protease AprX
VKAVLSDSPVQGASTGATTGGTSLASTFVPTVRADSVWDLGYKGSGVTVAIVDSGIGDTGNSDFGKRILTNVSFNSHAAYTIDKFGHGNHVAGIVGGNGANSAGKWMGVAPEVNLLNVKFSDDTGQAKEKDLVDALAWVYDNRSTYNIRVVNISATVGTAMSYKESPTAAAVEQLWFAGVVVVVSAGNRGGEACSVCYPPAADPFVITVGAVDDAGTPALNDDFGKEWSSVGTTTDGETKPDIMAPGAHIVSYMPRGSLRNQAPQNIVDKHYFQMGGTSMAAPMVTGVVALLLEARPDITPDQVKWLLRTTSRPYLNQPEGTPGIVDALSAVTYSESIAMANQGLAPSPLLDPDTGSISYSNTLWSNTLWSNTLWSNNYNF